MSFPSRSRFAYSRRPIFRGGLGAVATSPGSIPQMIADAASRYGIPSNLALEVAIKESGLNQNAISSAGAVGVMQLMPSTAADLGVDPTDAQQNINGGVQYLAQLLSEFAGDQAKALAAYNWGPGNVQNAVAQNGDNWLAAAPSSVQNYVKSILSATGQNYSVGITPASVAGGISGAGSGTSAPMLIGLALAGVVVVSLIFSDDDD